MYCLDNETNRKVYLRTLDCVNNSRWRCQYTNEGKGALICSFLKNLVAMVRGTTL